VTRCQYLANKKLTRALEISLFIHTCAKTNPYSRGSLDANTDKTIRPGSDLGGH